MNTTLAFRPTEIETRDLSPEGREYRLFVAWLRDVMQEQETTVTYWNLENRRQEFLSQLNQALSN